MRNSLARIGPRCHRPEQKCATDNSHKKTLDGGRKKIGVISSVDYCVSFTLFHACCWGSYSYTGKHARKGNPGPYVFVSMGNFPWPRTPKPAGRGGAILAVILE